MIPRTASKRPYTKKLNLASVAPAALPQDVLRLRRRGNDEQDLIAELPVTLVAEDSLGAQVDFSSTIF
jgi:hypothetical protein